MSIQTTPYAAASHLGSQTFGWGVNTPIMGSLNTHNYPNAMPYHSYGILLGAQTPPQFYPMQEPVYNDMNVGPKSQYKRATGISNAQQAIQNTAAKISTPMNYRIQSSQRGVAVSSHMNYIAPIDSSQALSIKKSIAIGKNSNYSNNAKITNNAKILNPISTKSYDNTIRHTHLRRVRSAGSVAPKKKGSIYNTSLNTLGGSGWGALPRANY